MPAALLDPHYVYILCFAGVPGGMKVGLSGALPARAEKHSTADRGALVADRCVAVAIRTRREAQTLESYLFRLYARSQYVLPTHLVSGDGDTEWLQVEVYEAVLDTIRQWLVRGAVQGHFVPFHEAVAASRRAEEGGRPSREERRRRLARNRAARDAARRAKNAANYLVCQQAIEAHLPYITKVTIEEEPNPYTRWLEARLHFRVRDQDGAPPNFGAHALARRLDEHAHLDLRAAGYAGMEMVESGSPLTTLLLPGLTPAREMLIVSRVPLHTIDEGVRHDTPEAEAWLRNLARWQGRVTRATGK